MQMNSFAPETAGREPEGQNCHYLGLQNYIYSTCFGFSVYIT